MLKRLIPLLALTLAAPAYAGGGSGIIKDAPRAALSVAACPADDPISALLPGFACTLVDKTFSGFDIVGAPADARVQFGTLGPLFAITLSRDGGFFTASRVIFDYTISAMAPNHIVEGSLGADVSFPPVTVISTMNGQMLTSVNGEFQHLVFGPGISQVVVDDTATLSGNAELNSITNDFTERRVSVAEPSMLALLVMGLAGLGLARLVRPS